MSVDTLLTNAGLSAQDITDYLGDVSGCLAAAYFGLPVPKYYQVTPETTEDEYTFVQFANHPVTILNGVATRSDEADIVITGEASLVEVDPCEVEEIPFAYHGNGIILNNAETAYTLSCLVVDRSVASINQSVSNELKTILWALKSRSSDAVFSSLQKMSTIKNNIISENRMPRYTVKRREIVLTPWAL